MDRYSVPIVLLVALCRLSVVTRATSTVAPSTNNATMMPSATNATMMPSATNATMMPSATNATMMPSATNATMMPSATNATMMPSATNATMMPSATNATMMPSATNTTMMPSATNTTMMGGSNATGSSNTTTNAPVNSTMTPMTTANNTTTMAPDVTTTAPPLEANDTVVELSTNISNAQCGSTQLCATEPSMCSPDSGSCYFLGAKQTSGSNFRFTLSGETDGYLGATLKPTNSANETVYICARNNGKIKFITAFLLDNIFYRKQFPANNVKAKGNGRKIQCMFDATVPDSPVRADNTQFALSVVTGPYNATSDNLGTPMTRLRTETVNLATPANVSTTATNTTMTTAAPATTAGTVPLQHSVSSGLLIILGVLSLAWL